jgi:hypothetical protein
MRWWKIGLGIRLFLGTELLPNLWFLVLFPDFCGRFLALALGLILGF